ncbi:carbohydrate ABC transporter permease [Sanguibacter suaedae]|uniref:Sugar ABC transporter permease n=1 Tax=Sanguibacter suaedae TaxID=2795737 RepID=A0A934I9P1_9MICO|nr:sugar ABC transporter permease [Sanguibacter suaedae]MBI9113790.1 sugar ABC transporter permease [Sanguibacter suaedae]
MTDVTSAPAPPAALGTPLPRTDVRPDRTNRRRRALVPYLFLAPVATVLLLALGYPLVRQVVMSFQEFGLAQQFGTAEPEWVGLDNYAALVDDATMWGVVARSLAFCVVNAGLTMVIGTAVATLMTQLAGPVRLALQTCLLLAWAMPVIAAMTVWQWLFDTQYGVVNWALVQAGLADFAGHSWLLEPLSFYAVATVIVVWMSVPFVAFSVYAALTQVSDEVLEAAQLDGAGGWQRFRHIVVPTIAPVLSVVTLLQIIWDLRVFAQIYYLQGAGGLRSQTDLLGTYIYNLGIGQSNYGMASAVAMFMLVLTLVLTIGYVRRLAKEED